MGHAHEHEMSTLRAALADALDGKAAAEQQAKEWTPVFSMTQDGDRATFTLVMDTQGCRCGVDVMAAPTKDVLVEEVVDGLTTLFRDKLKKLVAVQISAMWDNVRKESL